MAWLLYRKAGNFAEIGDITQTLKFPIAPFVYLMAALTLATRVHLVHVADAAAARRPVDQAASVVCVRLTSPSSHLRERTSRPSPVAPLLSSSRGFVDD